MAEVDALAQKSDPLNDDWPGEILHAYAKKQLVALADRLVSSTAGDLDGVSIGPLRPQVEEVIADAHMRVARFSSSNPNIDTTFEPMPLGEAFEQLMQPFRGATGVRVAFKIVGVQVGDDGSFTTTALFQVSGVTSTGPLQFNARWKIAWRSAEVVEHPRIASITVESHDEVWLRRTRFADATHSIIASDEAWRDQLSRGGEHWYGRIDAVGELNFFGHQGIAIGDVNGDGLDDVYVALGTGLPNKLYVQNADGTATETALAAGVGWLDDTKGVLLVDLDNDGDQDLLCAMGPTILFCANDGTGRFTPARKLRAASEAAFYSLAAADYDLDGDLDIYACRYVKARYGQSVPMPFHDANNGPPNHLLRNDGPDGFTDVTFQVGLGVNNNRFSLAASWADYDDDGDPDLYVANDFGRNNLYRNDGGVFVDVAATTGTEDQAAGMGVSWSDYDLDGDLDLLVSNMFSSAGQRVSYQPRFKSGLDQGIRREIQHHSLGNALFANSGDGTFIDASDSAGIRMGRWSWGAMFVDFDNDGYDDVVVPNGFLTNPRKDDL